MSVSRSCTACRNLQEKSPDFVMNGVTEAVDASLRNNTGFNPSSGNNDCTDLNDANDCLIGNMEDEVDAHQVCDWKPFMEDFIHNLWSVIKAVNSAICGLWTRTERNTCTIEAITNGFKMNIGEEETDGSYVVAGKGVSFFKDSTGSGTKDIELRYIGGGLARVTGTLRFSTSNFSDGKAAYSYDDDGANPTKSANRKGNSLWMSTAGTTVDGKKYYLINMLSETELMFEIRIKKSEFPGLKSLVSGIGAPTGGGNYQVNLVCYSAGSAAHGQHYSSSPTHVVPAGWIYVQARMISIGYLNATLKHHYTPRGFIGIRIDQDTVPCDGGDDGGDEDGGGDTPEPSPEPSPEPTPDTYLIQTKAVWRSESGTINVVSTTGGSATPVSQSVVVGTSVTLTASANAGFTFVGWGNYMNSTTYLSTNSTYTFTPSDNKTYYAIFVETASEDTEVTESVTGVSFVAGASGTKSYTLENTPTFGTGILTQLLYGASIAGGPNFVAGTAESYDMSQVTPTLTGIIISYDGDKTLTMTSTGENTYNIAIREAKYVYGTDKTMLELRVMTDGSTEDQTGGTVSGGGMYTTGSSVTISATPSHGYSFVEWGYGGQVSIDNPYTFTLNDDTVLYGVFEKNPERVIESPDNAYDSTAVFVDGSLRVSQSFTITNTPVTGTTVKVTIEHFDSGIGETLEFTAGTSATLTPTNSVFSNVTVQYDGDKQITLVASAVLGSRVYLIKVEYYK